MSWTNLVRTVIGASVIVVAVAVAAIAQQPQQGALKRATLQTGDFPAGFETVMVIAQMEPGECSGWHTHPGLESSYFLEGEVLIKFAGRPDQVVCNISGGPFKALAHYIVEKGKPLASPVPAPDVN
jgi:hypothetical protein